MIDSADGGEVAFANLNYDALLMAAICRDYNHDLLRLDRRAVPKCLPLHHGRRLGTGASTLKARETAVPSPHAVAPPRALAWLHKPGNGRVYKLGIDDLRLMDYWTLWRQGRTDWFPVVVLTNQPGKAKLIREQPFSVPYEIFRQRLLTANSDRRHLPPRCGRLRDAAHSVERPERAAAGSLDHERAVAAHLSRRHARSATTVFWQGGLVKFLTFDTPGTTTHFVLCRLMRDSSAPPDVRQCGA
jgi:hypothetical protein